MRWLPHLITSLRILALPFITYCLVHSQYRTALLLVLIAGLSDWFDGFAARQIRADSSLGVVFDPLADKLLLVTLYIATGLLGLIPIWVLYAVVGRDLIIVIGAALVRALRGVKKFKPLTVGKVSTFFQIVLMLLTLSYSAYPFSFLLWLKVTAIILCGVFTVWSGIEYVRLGIRMAKLPKNAAGAAT